MMGRMQKRAAEARVYVVSGGEGGYQRGCVCLGEAAPPSSLRPGSADVSKWTRRRNAPDGFATRSLLDLGHDERM